MWDKSFGESGVDDVIILMMLIFAFFFQVALEVVWPVYSFEDGYLWTFPVLAMREISSSSSSSDCERQW